jgi:hypothetical protein
LCNSIFSAKGRREKKLIEENRFMPPFVVVLSGMIPKCTMVMFSDQGTLATPGVRIVLHRHLFMNFLLERCGQLVVHLKLRDAENGASISRMWTEPKFMNFIK